MLRIEFAENPLSVDVYLLVCLCCFNAQHYNERLS